MVEGLAILTGVELGKWVLEQMLDLGKPVLENYVQDFFRDSLDSGVARLNVAALKTPMAEAVGVFIKRFIKELQLNDVPDTSIEHYYRGAIKRFVQDKAVRPLLGKAFEKDCQQIDYTQIEKIWKAQYQGTGWQFPSEDFEWRRLGKEYVIEVRGIVKANEELRAILTTNLLEDIARNTAQLSPGFDTETYRASLQASYGYLNLYTLDSTDRADTIKLWNIFIEQTVREALPPTRYDLPLDIKRQLQSEGRLEYDLSTEALEYYRRDYFQQPARKVLEAVADSPRAVILGDPGAGKSSLLQYLALEWVEGNTETLPLLIELREFALADSASFLDFLHRGRGVDWQFDQQQLHQHLMESPTLVMFDGLDEIFDRATQSAVIDDIIRFAQQYPQARVLVTSRIIGYNYERFQHSGFRNFTIQSLDSDEIHEFIGRWSDLSIGSDPDREQLKQRLKDAIANSNAIQNLADNPLLLTMMAILNRRQELPRDRVDLFARSSELLLHKWDFEQKADLKDPRWEKYAVEIDYRDKQAILRQIAYFMQASSEGLRGNHISRENLERCLNHYLKKTKETSNYTSITKILIDQLRRRDSIICHYGNDAYGFVHRAFLEYFCAAEITSRINKKRIDSQQLCREYFWPNWLDESWREVICLICGLVDTDSAQIIVNFLLESSDPLGEFDNIFVADDCLFEIADKFQSDLLRRQVFSQIIEIANHLTKETSLESCPNLTNLEGSGELNVLRKSLFLHMAVEGGWIEYFDTNPVFRVNVPQETIARYPDSEGLINSYLVEILEGEIPFIYIAMRIVHAITSHYPDFSEGLEFIAAKSKDENIDPRFRMYFLEGLCEIGYSNAEAVSILCEIASNDPDEEMRKWAQERVNKIKLKVDT